MNTPMLSPRLSTALAASALAALVCLAQINVAAKELPANSHELARQLNQAFADVAEQASPAVVVIKVAHKHGALDLSDEESPFWEMLPPEFRKQLEQYREKQRQSHKEIPPPSDPVFDSQGSGVVAREDGFIMTNRHVIDGAEKIRVRFRDGAEYEAEVRGVDSRSDMAVIKINTKGKKLPVARMGNSDKTRVGEFAIAIGAPFELDYSVTFGHVSAKGRSRIIPDPSLDQDFLQTDANINPGNSGGPLVNIEGEVIGINTMIRGLRTGIGFAIPINLAREVADQLISEGRFTRSWLGVGIKALREDTELRDLSEGVADGVVVTIIQSNGPAAKSDLKPSDIIKAVDGKPVATAQQLKSEIRAKKVGQMVTLDVHRGGKEIKIKVKTDAWPDDPILVARHKSSHPESAGAPLGLKVDTLTDELAEQYEVDRLEGVIVTEVEGGSPAQKKGLNPGDIITEVNRKTVRTPKQFREAVKAGDPKKGIIINFVTRGTRKFEILKQANE